jgi:hypothetical protein
MLCALALLTAGCGVQPTLPDAAVGSQDFGAHAQTQQDEQLQVGVAVLSADQARSSLGIDLADRWLQAVWIEIENRDDKPYWLLFPSIDDNYFAPDEVAFAMTLMTPRDDSDELMRRLRSVAFRNPIAPGTVESGLVFVSMDLDAKLIDVHLLSASGIKEFAFTVPVGEVNAETLFDVEHRHASPELVEVDEQGLLNELARYPCCTTNASGSLPGDPLNLVLIGNADDLFTAFVRRGWHATEATYAGSVRKTVASYLFGERYIYSPISPLYALGRPQDIAFQKARGTIHQRNHLRLWLTPLRHRGKSVWLGQVSRDIGVKFTTRAPVLFTHVIDPDVDETRDALVQDLLYSRGLVKIGYLMGAPPATDWHPARNLTADPYFTDGLRAVMLLDKSLRAIGEVAFFDWDHPLPYADGRELDPDNKDP